MWAWEPVYFHQTHFSSGLPMVAPAPYCMVSKHQGVNSPTAKTRIIVACYFQQFYTQQSLFPLFHPPYSQGQGLCNTPTGLTESGCAQSAFIHPAAFYHFTWPYLTSVVVQYTAPQYSPLRQHQAGYAILAVYCGAAAHSGLPALKNKKGQQVAHRGEAYTFNVRGGIRVLPPQQVQSSEGMNGSIIGSWGSNNEIPGARVNVLIILSVQDGLHTVSTGLHSSLNSLFHRLWHSILVKNKGIRIDILYLPLFSLKLVNTQLMQCFLQQFLIYNIGV